MEIRIGDRVIFHLLTEHRCGGRACACTPDRHLPATIVHVWPKGDREVEVSAVVLDVEFSNDDLACDAQGAPLELERVAHDGAPISCRVTRHGYVSRQNHSPLASASGMPASGSWTPVNVETKNGDRHA